MIAAAVFGARSHAGDGRWTEAHAEAWYAEIDWPVGGNFVPSSAINQLEMWQASTFDPVTIDRELGWAARVGMNSMRVFLHDIAWRDDPEGFFARVDEYLEIADRHGIRTMLVLFDGVWNPSPKSGPQPVPTPRVHNSGWVQSPGAEILGDPSRHDELKPYVQSVIRRYADDERVLIWDLFNEPDNAQMGKFGDAALARDQKRVLAGELLDKTFDWAREINPSQPLTSGVWDGADWLNSDNPIDRISLSRSDVISFHVYDGPIRVQERIDQLESFGRPVMCTEYMARGANSTFENTLPKFARHRIGAYHWGLVSGRSQTIFPWNSWNRDYPADPDPWFHDVFRSDGTPYDQREVDLIRRLTTEVGILDALSVAEPREPRPASELLASLERHDRAVFVKPGWIRDPYIVRDDDGFYYLTGTTPLPDDPRQISDPYNTGLPENPMITGLGNDSLVGWKMQAWRSRDLVNWEWLGTPYSLLDGVWAQKRAQRFRGKNRSNWRLWAPEIYRVDGRWAVTHTSPAPVAGANLSLSPGSDLAGPWENPMGTGIQRRHDPSLFQDDDGTWWMIWGATRIAPLSADFSRFTAKPTRIGPTGETASMGHEGCVIRKIDGKYVLFGTGWSTAGMRRGSYNLYYATADAIEGPYSERKFVGRFLGHGTPFQDEQDRWWCTAFFNANVPPLDRTGIRDRDLRATAQTINEQGVTLVPLDVRTDADGELIIRAKDPDYAVPGPDELQPFPTLTEAHADDGDASRRPNIVFVFIDDMGYADLSCYGGTRTETAHIDRLAREGARFTRFYVNSPICSPSRTAGLTGQYPQRWGIESFLNSRESNKKRGMPDWLDPGAPSIARAFNDAGYHVAHVGKWHIGGQREIDDAPLITDYGFDTSLTNFEGLGDRVLATFEKRANRLPRKHWPTDTSAKVDSGTITWVPRHRVTETFVDRAIKEIDYAQGTNQRFFINVWPDDMHTPVEPEGGLRYPDVHRYTLVLDEMDRQLGRLFDRIRNDPDLAENTLVLVSSDNGHEPGFGSGGFLRGAKTTLYEGGIRMPLIAWWPGVVSSGWENHVTPISGFDLFPSLASIAGIEIPDAALDGVSMARALLGRVTPDRAGPLFFSRPVDRAGPKSDPHPDLAMIEYPWKLLVDDDGANARLFNLRRDPGERRDVSSQNADRTQAMTRRTMDWAEWVRGSGRLLSIR
ncbi:MAG: sulfatase-like hydrolase/transferase [Planctomycetota bacterium]